MSAVMEEKTFRGLREIAILVFFAVAVFFLISLVTFSNEDAGWTHSGTGQKVVNACGLSGAWLADFTLSFFGLCGYLFPIIICWHGYLLYARIRQKQQKITTVLQWLGSIATIVASAALLYLYLLRVGIELPLGTGGILGQETGDAVLVLFGNSGATLFLIVLLLSGITLATDLSWIGFIDLIGGYTVAAFQFLGFMSTEDPKEPIKNSIQSFDSLVEKSVTKKKTPVKVERSVGQNTAPIEKSIPFYKPQKHAASN